MLWLGFYFPQLPLAIFAGGKESVSLAVTRREKGREVIDRCNALAQEQGIRAGMALNTALALQEDLQVRERNRKREQKLLEALAGWAWQYSSRISFDPLLILLEVGASLKLFGGFSALLEHMRRHPPCPDCLQYWALAPTPMAAALPVPAGAADNNHQYWTGRCPAVIPAPAGCGSVAAKECPPVARSVAGY